MSEANSSLVLTSLWGPNNSGYVNERDPLRAGLYQPDGYYAPWAHEDERPNDHSFTIDAAEFLSNYNVQDGTTLALLSKAGPGTNFTCTSG